ncbi:hypothetical protein HDV57DRAFT_92135 [Trichoderma longibrachiatum]
MTEKYMCLVLLLIRAPLKSDDFMSSPSLSLATGDDRICMSFPSFRGREGWLGMIQRQPWKVALLWRSCPREVQQSGVGSATNGEQVS